MPYDLTLLWNSKKKKLLDTENRLVIAREKLGVGGQGCEMDKGSEKIQTSSYTTNKSWYVMYTITYGDYSQ